MMPSMVPFTPMVKRLVIINAICWIGLVLIVQNVFMSEPRIFQWFGFTPSSVLLDFWLWQPMTYMFLHSENVFHFVFNMLVLWWFGADLENLWGGRVFLVYYLLCGFGAAIIYLAAIVTYSLITGDTLSLQVPVIGASGAAFGLMVAYGKKFGERVIYFMMMFPMKAKAFVALIAGIEVLNLLSSGVQSQTANLAHLGGIVVGYLLLLGWDGWMRRGRSSGRERRGRGLKLVVNNESSGQERQPRYWN
jgi:membrane associated rhomboid family serine protease